MEIPEGFLCMLAMVVVVTIILVINDATKRNAVRTAKAKGRKVNPAWKDNQTTWGSVISPGFRSSIRPTES